MSVFISNDVKSTYPNFSKLLDEIHNKVGNTDVSKLESKFWLSKSEWLEEHITFALVQAILNQMHLKMLDNTMEEDDTRCWKAVTRCFYLHQCPDYLHTNKMLVQYGETNLDDLSRGKLLLAAELEKKLEDIGLKLVDARDGPESSENNTIHHARALQVGSILKEDKSNYFFNQQQLKELNAEEVNIHITYHQALEDCTDLFIKFITKYTLRLQPLKDKTVAKNALCCCEAFSAKLKSIKRKLECETYTPQAIEVLKKLRSEIIEKIQQRELQLADIEQQLEIFRRLGSGFEAIVNEYANAKSELERQQWTLNEVKEKLKTM